MATNPRQAERESTEAARETGRKVAEEAAQTARTMADTGERMTRAGSETAERNMETMSNAWRESSEAASRIAERSMDQVSKMFGLTGDAARQSLQQSSGNMQAILESSTLMADALQQISGEWMRFAHSTIEQNLNRLEQLQGCRTMQDVMALQTQIARDNLESILHTARRTSEVSTRIAEQATSRMSDTTLAPR